MLRALDLTKSYDGAPLFDGLSLTLNAGERAGLVGPNGAGKSTLLRLLAGREQPDRGAVTTTARVGYLPQEAPAGDATLDTLLRDALGEAGEALAALSEPGDLDRYAHALERAEATDAWAAEARADEIRRRLAIDHLPGDRPLAGSRAASRRARCWRRRCWRTRRCCCSTSRPTTSTPRAWPGSRPSSATSTARCSSSPTTAASSTPSSIASTS